MGIKSQSRQIKFMVFVYICTERAGSYLPKAQEKELMAPYTNCAVTALTSTICTPSGLRFHAGGKMSKPYGKLSQTHMKTAMRTAQVRMMVTVRQWQSRCGQPWPAPVGEIQRKAIGTPKSIWISTQCMQAHVRSSSMAASSSYISSVP